MHRKGKHFRRRLWMAASVQCSREEKDRVFWAASPPPAGKRKKVPLSDGGGDGDGGGSTGAEPGARGVSGRNRMGMTGRTV